MQGLTLRETGAEGICLAIQDGMKAAVYARERDAVKAESDRLKNTVESLKSENRRLNNANRHYRFSRSRAYETVLERLSGIPSFKEIVLTGVVIFLLGMVAGLAVAFGILLFKAV